MAKRHNATTIRKCSSKMFLSIGVVGLFITVYIYNHFPEASAAPIMSGETLGDFTQKMESAVFLEKIVHLDLKGAPPSIDFMKEFLHFIKSFGATGVLIEYEDMFPYSGELEGIPARNAYSKDNIKQFLKIAENNDLEVIPLVQTFGHLEFVLKLEQFAHLREVQGWHQVICPSRNSTLQLIVQMLTQIKDLHPNIKRLHIGSDEVYNFGECPDCITKMQQKQWQKTELFLDHVSSVASYVKNVLKVTPLMWDDEFRNLPEKEIRQSGLGDLVEVVVWQYSQTVLQYLRPELFTKYSNIFKNIWAASAFKGATGADSYMTPIGHHLANHRSWMDLAISYKDQVSFKGIVLTGWQRYDHFSVLCELLPVGLPSLVTNLILLDNYSLTDAMVVERARLALECDGPLVTDDGTYFGSDLITRCRFPGSGVYSAMQKLTVLKRRFNAMKEIQGLRGWLSEYNIRHKYSSPAILDRFIGEISSNRIDAESLENDLRSSLGGVYDNHTISEVIETYLSPIKDEIEKMWNARNEIAQQNFFPRRPF